MKVDRTLEMIHFPPCCTNIDVIGTELIMGTVDNLSSDANVALTWKPPRCVWQLALIEQSGTEVTFK